MPEYSNYQKKLIDRYYDHQDVIMLNKLQELVTDLFLADTAKKSDRLWARAEKAMRNLKIKDKVMANILEKRDPQVLAANVRDWLNTAGGQGGK